MRKGAVKRVEAEKQIRDNRSFAAAAARLRKMRGNTETSTQPLEEHKRLPPTQAAVLPLFGEKLKAIPEGKPVLFTSVEAILTIYVDYQNKMQLALQALDPLSENREIADCSRYSRKREAEQKNYFVKLDNLILACDSYAKFMKALANYSSYIFNEDILKFINQSISVFTGALAADPNDDAKALVVKFNRLLEFINNVVFVRKNKLEAIDDQYWELREDLLRFTSLFGRHNENEVSSGSKEEDDESLSEISAVFSPMSKKEVDGQAMREMESRVSDLFKFVDNKRKVLADMRNVMHNARIAIMQSRFLMLVQPDKDVLQKYKEYSLKLRERELELLKIFKNISDQQIHLWPHFNEDLLRPQSRQITVSVESIIVESRKALKVMKAVSPEGYIPSIEIINKCEEANITLGQGKGYINTLLSAMTDYLKDIELSPLVKFFVLSVAIHCYAVKNPLRTNLNKSRVDNLWKDIESQFALIKDFEANLNNHKFIFEGELFQFLSNFIILPHYLQEVIGATEHAFLHCENLFTAVNKDNLEFKNEILKMQIKLLEMQDAILNFAKNKLGKDYGTNFYLKTGKEGYFHLWTLKKNQQLMKDGAQNIITEGLPITVILERNELLRLRLEAIPLEFISGQRPPQDSDYTCAMSQCEMEKFLKQCDRDHEKEAKKKRNLKKSVEKKAESKTDRDEKAYQSDYESEEESQDEVVVVEPTVGQPKDQLTVRMTNLLSQLHRNNFSSDLVRQAITEFHPLTLTSDNTVSLFKALYVVGDCYSMVASHNINHKGEWAVIIADCKLALNYYRRAAIVLAKLQEFNLLSAEEHQFYSEWLAGSISTHENQVERYQNKLLKEFANLEASRQQAMERLGDQWYKNHEEPGWQESVSTERRKGLDDALGSLSFCKRKCKELKVGIGKKSDWKADRQAYAFEHHLDSSNQRPIEPDYLDPDFDAEENAASTSEGVVLVDGEEGQLPQVSVPVPAAYVPAVPVPTSASALVPATTNNSLLCGVTFSRVVDLSRGIPQPQPSYIAAENEGCFITISMPLATNTYPYSSSSISMLAPLAMTSPHSQSISSVSTLPLIAIYPSVPVMTNTTARLSTGDDPLDQYRRKDELAPRPMMPYGSSRAGGSHSSGDKGEVAQSR